MNLKQLLEKRDNMIVELNRLEYQISEEKERLAKEEAERKTNAIKLSFYEEVLALNKDIISKVDRAKEKPFCTEIETSHYLFKCYPSGRKIGSPDPHGENGEVYGYWDIEMIDKHTNKHVVTEEWIKHKTLKAAFKDNVSEVIADYTENDFKGVG